MGGAGAGGDSGFEGVARPEERSGLAPDGAWCAGMVWLTFASAHSFLWFVEAASLAEFCGDVRGGYATLARLLPLTLDRATILVHGSSGVQRMGRK